MTKVRWSGQRPDSGYEAEDADGNWVPVGKNEVLEMQRAGGVHYNPPKEEGE